MASNRISVNVQDWFNDWASMTQLVSFSVQDWFKWIMQLNHAVYLVTMQGCAECDLSLDVN